MWASSFSLDFFSAVPAGSPSRGGDVATSVFDINQQSLPTPFYSILVSVSVFVVLSTVFHSINSPDNSPLFHSVLPSSFCLIGPFNCISLYEIKSMFHTYYVCFIHASMFHSFIQCMRITFRSVTDSVYNVSLLVLFLLTLLSLPTGIITGPV